MFFLYFVFSYSWGYRRVFEEYAQFLNQNFPKLQIVGDNYPPPRPRQMLASIMSFTKLLIIGMIIFGERLQIFENFNIQPPPIYQWAVQNKVGQDTLYYLSSVAYSVYSIKAGIRGEPASNITVFSVTCAPLRQNTEFKL